MAPKKGKPEAAVNPSEVVAKKVAELQEGLAPAAAKTVLNELSKLCPEPGGPEALLEQGTAVSSAVAALVQGVAASEEPAAEHAEAVAAAVELISALLAASPSSMFSNDALLKPLVALLSAPPGVSDWGEASPERVQLAQLACKAVRAIAMQPEGCVRLRISGAVPLLVGLVDPLLGAQVSSRAAAWPPRGSASVRAPQLTRAARCCAAAHRCHCRRMAPLLSRCAL